MAKLIHTVPYESNQDVPLEEFANREKFNLANWIAEAIQTDPTTYLVIDLKELPIVLTETFGELALENLDSLVRQLQATRGVVMPADITNIWDRISLEPMTNFAIWGLMSDYRPNEKFSIDFDLT